jgi:hypothetical protein
MMTGRRDADGAEGADGVSAGPQLTRDAQFYCLATAPSSPSALFKKATPIGRFLRRWSPREPSAPHLRPSAFLLFSGLLFVKQQCSYLEQQWSSSIVGANAPFE